MNNTLTIHRAVEPSESITASSGTLYLPAIISAEGEKTTKRFLEFFASTIRNKNTRLAYYRAVCKFFKWCEARGVEELNRIKPLLVIAFIEEETNQREAQTIALRLPRNRTGLAFQSGVFGARAFLFD